jgi:nucleoside-diphosphate-sugar epimerase/phosphoheptose isomerase
MADNIKSYYQTLRNLTENITVTDKQGIKVDLPSGVDKVIELIEQCRKRKNKLIFIGNGASAAIASHMSVDFWKNAGVKAIAFNDSSLLTCVSNDYGYKYVFQKPIEMFASRGDVLVAISSSGSSENILSGVDEARKKGCKVITLSGFSEDNPLSEMGDINFYVPARAYSHVEIMHHSICHYTLDIIMRRKGDRGMIRNVLVTGGAGYVGSVLVSKLLNQGYNVKVVDLYIYGEDVLDSVKDHPNLEQIKGDIRDKDLLKKELRGMEAVIHLACISNDPSYELNPDLGKSINYDAFISLVDISKELGVRRFIYASSSSVYGIKEEDNVTEDLSLNPLTDYSKYKALCEEYLLKQRTKDFVVLVLRPATVCGYSPRLRLDLSVNILTNHAVNKGKITVFGGEQRRPNIHMEDVTDLYVKTLQYQDEEINGKVFNAGYHNMKMKEIAQAVKDVVSKNMDNQGLEIVTTSTDDNRSYHISSEKIRQELGFEAKRSVNEAIGDICDAFKDGKISNPMEDKRYYNIKTMQAINLK